MFQGRGMGHFGGRESAASIPLPCRVITSRCTRFVCSFIHSFVCLFGWLLGCLSAPSHQAPNPRALPHHLVAVSHLSSLSHRCQVVASSHLVSPLPSPLVAWCQCQHPPCCSSSTAWGIDCMARCLLGGVYGCICFGLVTLNECVNFCLATCHRTVLKFGKNKMIKTINKV